MLCQRFSLHAASWSTRRRVHAQRNVTARCLPDSRVTGAALPSAARWSADTKRPRPSPILASSCAAQMRPLRNKGVTIFPSGCASTACSIAALSVTACSRAAQSRPTKYCMGTPLVERPPTREGPAERSSTGAPRRASRGATSCRRSRSPGLSEAAGLTVAVKRLATEAVLGAAPEDLSFTLEDLDRGVNLLASTTGGCTDELPGSARCHLTAALRAHPDRASLRDRDRTRLARLDHRLAAGAGVLRLAGDRRDRGVDPRRPALPGRRRADAVASDPLAARAHGVHA